MKDKDISYFGTAITDLDILRRVPESYQQLLSEENGFVLFGGGLHVRGAVFFPEWHSLRKVWMGDFALHRLFPVLRESDIPFAQDCFGNQFLLRDGLVHRLMAELGELVEVGMQLESFMSDVEKKPEDFLSLESFQAFRRKGGQLHPGQLVAVYPPFCTKESRNGVSMNGIDMFDCVGGLATFARQIADVPDGTQIRIKVTH